MQGPGGEELAGSGFAFNGHQAEMGCGAAHSTKELLHGETTAGHGAEHPLFRLEVFGLEGLRLKDFEAEEVGGRDATVRPPEGRGLARTEGLA
jgi:hypothetical protein